MTDKEKGLFEEIGDEFKQIGRDIDGFFDDLGEVLVGGVRDIREEAEREIEEAREFARQERERAEKEAARAREDARKTRERARRDADELFRDLDLDMGDLFRDLEGFDRTYGRSRSRTRRKRSDIDSDIFVSRTEEEIAREGLIETFTKGLKERTRSDRIFLEEAVEKHAGKVMKLKGSDLLRAHARACVYVGNLELAAESYTRARKLTAKEATVLGLIRYNQRKIGDAKHHLERVEINYNMAEWAPEGILALSYIRLESGEQRLGDHEGLTSASMRRLAGARNFLGTMHFNKKDYETAARHFGAAVDLDPSDEESWLRMMGARNLVGDIVDTTTIGEFYHSTGSTLNENQLWDKLGRKHLPMQPYQVSAKRLDDILNT